MSFKENFAIGKLTLIVNGKRFTKLFGDVDGFADEDLLDVMIQAARRAVKQADEALRS